jgi:hypothetical protein
MSPNEETFPDILELMRQSAAASRVNHPSVALKARGLWKTLEAFAESNPPAAVLASWRHHTGPEFGTMGNFLRAAARLAQVYPCLSESGCGDPHEVVSLDDGRWLARSQEDLRDCPAIWLTEAELTVYELDTERFGVALCRALGFEPASASGASEAAPKLWPVGTHLETRSPAFLALCPNESQLMLNLQGLMAVCREPFILLAPTARHRSELIGSMLQRERCAFIPLAPCLAPDGDGFRLAAPVAPVLDRFAAGLATGDGLVKTVERIDRNIEAVAQDKYELRKENEELRQLNKEGYFNFAVRVNGEDFLTFAVVMALGNRKAAADHLKIPARTLYHRVDQWAGRGKDYKLMLRYLEWRKRSSRHLKVELNPSLQSGESGDQPENPETMADVLTEIKAADNRDYPALLAEVLEALQRQNSGNWTMVRQELVEMIKDEV